MSDLSPLPLILTASDRLSRSATPEAPVIPQRRRLRLRGSAGRARVSRPRIGKE